MTYEMGVSRHLKKKGVSNNKKRVPKSKRGARHHFVQTLSLEDKNKLDVLAFRFAKLQDLLGQYIS